MPVFKVTGFEKSSARNVTWYIHGNTPGSAEARAGKGGLVDVEVEEIDLAAVPPDVTLIRADAAPPRTKPATLSLFWLMVLAVIVGNVVTAAILKLFASF